MIVTGVVAVRVKRYQSSSVPDEEVPEIAAGSVINWPVAAELFAAVVSVTAVGLMLPAQPLPSVRAAVNWVIPVQERPVSL